MLLEVIIVINIIITALLMLIMTIHMYHNQYTIRMTRTTILMTICHTCIYVNDLLSAKTKPQFSALDLNESTPLLRTAVNIHLHKRAKTQFHEAIHNTTTTNAQRVEIELGGGE